MSATDPVQLAASLTADEIVALRVLTEPAAHGGGGLDVYPGGSAYGWLIVGALRWTADDQMRVRDIVERLHDLGLSRLERSAAFTIVLDSGAPTSTPLGASVLALAPRDAGEPPSPTG